MRPRTALCVLACLLGGCARDSEPPSRSDTPMTDDPYLWLEEVAGDKPLEWVRSQNAECRRELEAAAGFETLRARLLAIMDSKERIPFVAKHGRFLYNFWRDDRNPRGLWRRTTLEEYRKPEPAWETVLDLDRLAADEQENWVWHGVEYLEPTFDRAMVSLSRGGADASVIREFDVEAKRFVAGGFALPEAKCWTSWRNRDTLYVGTDFGPGSMTTSGYTRIAKEWKRGTPLESARTVFEGKAEDVSAGVDVRRDHGRVYELAYRAPSFFTSEYSVRRGDAFVRIEKPGDVDLSTHDRWLLFRLRSDWTLEGRTWKAGSLLAADFEAWMSGGRAVVPLFEPTERKSLANYRSTKSFLILTELENVRSNPFLVSVADGTWKRTPIEAPEYGVVDAWGVDADESDEYFLHATDYLTPSTLSLCSGGKREMLKSMPAQFRTDGLEIRQYEAVSRDGTRIPYFLVSRRGLALDGANPTMLAGYGGFEVPRLPSYNPVLGASWLEAGGVYVNANIRGGGEFGPAWHNAARKQHRQRAYDDFIAVAEDLIARKVTSPRHLGIAGRSNGGLLVGVVLAQRPELFRAVHCGNPLLDMKRYHKLLAGASWMDEYGDPDKPEEWAFIRNFSPYHMISKDRKTPRVLFTTSTRDDRVHPGHARKMFARMQEQGHDALYYENIEGGHGSAADNRQSAFMEALAYTFLMRELR